MKIKKIKILGFITIYKVVTFNKIDKIKKDKKTKTDKLKAKLEKMEGSK